MATMIPEIISPAAPPSEKQIFASLRDDTDTGGWVVIHSSGHIPAQGKPREIDFLAMVPDYGLICIEVKGGGFNVEAGQWRSLPSGSPVEPPVTQSERAMYALKNELEREYYVDPEDLPPIDCVVVFTDSNWPDNIRRPTRTVIDHEDLHSTMSLGRRLQMVARRMRPVAGRKTSATQPFTVSTINSLRRYLAPDFTMTPLPAVGPQLDIIDRQLIRFTEEQYVLLDLVSDNERCLFRGAAGTGKTMLALECARRAVASNRRVGLMCFNALLGNWLSQQAAAADGSITAGRFWHNIMRPLIMRSSAGTDFVHCEKNAADANQLFHSVYPEFARRALRELGPQFDILIIDEAQDLCQQPYLEIINLALTGGLASGRWTMFGDFTNQAIYISNSTDPEGNLLGYCPHPTRLQLRINCRNTPAIARDTAQVVGSDIPQTPYWQVHGPAPQYRYWDDGDELSNLLDQEVHRLLTQDVRIGEIVTLATSRLDNTGIDADRTYGGRQLADYSRGQRITDDPQNADHQPPSLKFCTVQSFKGLESHVVILILERLDRGHDLPNAYTGMSRARSVLTVLAHSSLKNELEARLAR